MRIYKIINLVNDKFYVGKDSTDNDNYWGSGILIRKAIKKYGIENFAREIIEYCNDLDELSEREKYWIKELDAIKYGYNIARGGEGGDTLSKNPRREEIIEKIRASNLGKKRTGQALDNIRNAIHKIDKAVMKMMIEKMVESRKRKRIERGHRTKKRSGC